MPGYLLHIPYLLLIQFLGLDIPWFVQKIIRIEKRYNRPQLKLGRQVDKVDKVATSIYTISGTA